MSATTMEHLIATVRAFDGSLVLLPHPDDDSPAPEIAWGDAFFYYAPDGRPPANTQPYATIVTKNYPGDTVSALDHPDRWRVNIHVSRTAFHHLTSERPRALADTGAGAHAGAHTGDRDYAAPDTLLPHPVYGTLSWVCVVNPAVRTLSSVVQLLHDAHEAARTRTARRKAR